MKIGDKITDGTATFLVRSTGGVQSVNNVRPDDTGNINITNIDNANHANTADMFSKTGNELGVLLWNMFHRYGNNYVPSDTSNHGWNSLGLCIIYYTDNRINNQPTQYGQLINIPADKNNEATQIWIEQSSGAIYSRGGNGERNINTASFIRRG